MKTEISIQEQLDDTVINVVSNYDLNGFKKAYIIAEATVKLKSLLNNEYMKPIMNLQGNKLGFKTDKDTTGGYTEEVVKNCLIEAVLTGVQPVGNQFNIIANNMYITKEGFGYLLSNVKGLWYRIFNDLPRMTETSAAIKMNIEWSLFGGAKEKITLDIPIKLNNRMGTDAVIGKATRKARAWLYNSITGCEVSDGDVFDLDSKNHTKNIDLNALNENEEDKRILKHLDKCETIDQFNELKKDIPQEILIRLEQEFDNVENQLLINSSK